MNETPPPLFTIGHNMPPMTPYETVKARIDGLYMEARNWLDGAPVDTANLAAGVEQLEVALKAAIKSADDERKAENVPFDTGKAAVQEKYNLLIGNTLTIKGTAIQALEACKAALTPWRVKCQQEAEAKARAAREEADRKAAEALAAHRAADAANLAEKERADVLLADAEKANRIAKAADKAATTKTGIVTTYRPDVTDLQALLKHIWIKDPDGLRLFAADWARTAVRNAGQLAASMQIPGVVINTIKTAR